MNGNNCTEHKVRKELIESTITMNNDSIIHPSDVRDAEELEAYCFKPFARHRCYSLYYVIENLR